MYLDIDTGFWSRFLMPIACFVGSMLIAWALGGMSRPEPEPPKDKKKDE